MRKTEFGVELFFASMVIVSYVRISSLGLQWNCAFEQLFICATHSGHVCEAAPHSSRNPELVREPVRSRPAKRFRVKGRGRE